MDNLRSGVQVLSFSRKGDTGKLCPCPLPVENTHRIQIGYMRTKGTGYPLNLSAFFYFCSLCIQVVHIFRPVLNNGITKGCIFSHIQFHASGMKICHIVFRCRAAFNKMKISTFIYNDQCVFKLSGSRCIESEIRLQRNLHRNTRRHINKGTSGPYCSVKCCKFMILRRHKFHKVFPNHVCVRTGQRTFHICIDNTLCSNLCFYIVVNKFRVILRAHTGQRFSFCLGNSKLLERIFDVFRHI